MVAYVLLGLAGGWVFFDYVLTVYSRDHPTPLKRFCGWILSPLVWGIAEIGLLTSASAPSATLNVLLTIGILIGVPIGLAVASGWTFYKVLTFIKFIFNWVMMRE